VKSDTVAQKTSTEGLVEKAKNQFINAEKLLNDENVSAIVAYANVITNAKAAIDGKLNHDEEMFQLIDRTIQSLAKIATEQNDIFKLGRDDAKLKLALNLVILSKDETFRVHIPFFSRPDQEEKIMPLLSILDKDKRHIVFDLLKNDKSKSLEKLFLQTAQLKFKKIYDEFNNENESTIEEKLLPQEFKTDLQRQEPTRYSVATNHNSLFNNSIANRWQSAWMGVIPGAALYSMCNAGLRVALTGAFYGFLAAALLPGLPELFNYTSNKIGEACKRKSGQR
jgi:hypothetical protein